MGTITNEMIYEEILELDKRLQETLEDLQELVSFMRETNKELAAGQAKNDALKKRLFGDRFESIEANHV
ncbi:MULTISPECIES: hypothetical protein [Phyllobacterium]|uniref:Uncharacterized protein n=1 Tax=Phyllobacterium zundukense TaxID=1867719 RepID=A0A2N9VVT4_9HYPH|nr:MULTISPECIES: hypothetical protein [Phyllobacterium]ATU91337.1 hypothetical protein BLM14_06565 [Phyllobacterium zundukense]PIO43602.1 hypothetical protein B5P45_16950 [Phyllobacterium zundukense]UXN64300.1 hypothetical protein N8E89_18235 [Phyllobacterium sp. A18/5-2]